jgi:transcriptional regulator with XRE-family HTH domain
VPLAPPTTSAQLGTAIRLLRELRDASIEGLADDAGIHGTYLSGIERGKHNPSWRVVSNLAAALEITVGDLERLAGKQRRTRPGASPD